jgi:hypothetical protein
LMIDSISADPLLMLGPIFRWLPLMILSMAINPQYPCPGVFLLS